MVTTKRWGRRQEPKGSFVCPKGIQSLGRSLLQELEVYPRNGPYHWVFLLKAFQDISQIYWTGKYSPTGSGLEHGSRFKPATRLLLEWQSLQLNNMSGFVIKIKIYIFFVIARQKNLNQLLCSTLVPPFHLAPVKHEYNLDVGANPSINPDMSIGELYRFIGGTFTKDKLGKTNGALWKSIAVLSWHQK